MCISMGNSRSRTPVVVVPPPPPTPLTPADYAFIIMCDDIRVYGNSHDGTYNGVPFALRRMRSGDWEHEDYWCGYILYNKGALTDEEIEEIGNVTHGGITSEKLLGFDCSHLGDFTYCRRHGTYRTYQFVNNCIRNMIDVLTSLPSFDGANLLEFSAV
jgi:hypothetical protein